MEYLPESTRLLYAQLLTQCLHGAAPTGHGLSFVKKRIKGGVHWYLQVTVGSRKTQHYIGPDTPEVRDLVAREKELWSSSSADARERERLVAMLVSGGAYSLSGVEARVFELLERAGVFLAGGVLIGSHAFTVYGNMLGVHWKSETTRTQDVDIASDYRVQIGITDRKISLRQVLMDSELGFVEVPALDRKSPSTGFRIAGKQVSVELLTPMVGKTSAKPVPIASLGAYAEPIRFLDYLLVDPQPAVLVARAGMLVNVPLPARYALHKLVIAERRSPAFHTKTQKDISQAAQLIEALRRDRPGDLRLAWEAAQRQPQKFTQQLQAGLKRLPAEAREALESIAKDASRRKPRTR